MSNATQGANDNRPHGQKGAAMDPTGLLSWAFDLPLPADQCSAIYERAIDGWLAVQHDAAATRIEAKIATMRARENR